MKSVITFTLATFVVVINSQSFISEAIKNAIPSFVEENKNLAEQHITAGLEQMDRIDIDEFVVALESITPEVEALVVFNTGTLGN